MKNRIIGLFTILIIFISLHTQAQLFGKGKVISRSFNLKDFTKLNIEDFDGSIEVEVGKPYGISIAIDENLEPRLQVIAKNEKLTIKLEGNYNGKLYLENTRIKIKVSMPFASSIFHRGNTIIYVSGISGDNFTYTNKGNGDATLQGEVEKLEVKKSGNGNVNAIKIISKMAKINANGNGNVSVNASMAVMAHGVGNGNIWQYGKGKIDPMSGVVGNGEVKMN